MALTAKVETETEIKAPADKFFKLFRSQAHHLPNICSDKIHKIEVHEGGNSMSIKETVESIDEENRSITFKVLDGEVLKEYKSYKFTAQAIPKGRAKASEGGPDPHNYLEFAVNITKDIESHLLNA
ncbi:hypothetical protein AAG906_031417 [Vitis piasezkii]